MSWIINISRSAERFLNQNNVDKAKIFKLLERAIYFFQGGDVNINIKKLDGQWAGFYRIRMGKIRIMVEIDFDRTMILVEAIDWRGNIYK